MAFLINVPHFKPDDVEGGVSGNLESFCMLVQYFPIDGSAGLALLINLLQIQGYRVLKCCAEV